MSLVAADKLILCMLCMLSVTVFGPYAEFVVAFLTAVIISCISSSFEVKEGEPVRYVHEAAVICYILAAFWFDSMVAFLPIISYEIFFGKYYTAGGVYVCMVISHWHTCITTGAKGYIADYIVSLSACLAFTVLSYALYYKTSRNIKLDKEYRKLRDDSEEQSILMNSRNNELIARQDYEVYLATLQERNRIAREIHDNVGHMLTRAILMTGAVGTVEKDEAVRQQLSNLSDTLNAAMNNIRESVHDLHDDAINLEHAVGEITEAFDKFEINFEYQMGAEIPRDIKLCFIAITKEAVNNAAKHSDGDRIDIIMREQPGFYQLVIADNGSSVPEELTGGIGIDNMMQRVRNLGGSFNINTRNGFRITVAIVK